MIKRYAGPDCSLDCCCCCLEVWDIWETQLAKGDYPITRVSVILPHKDDGYWDLISDGVQEAWEELGDEYRIDINTLIPQMNYNIPQMIGLIRQQIAAQVDVLVIQGNDDPKFRETLQEAWNQGIQIICVDTDMKDFPEHLYVGTDNYAAGEMLGEKLVELTGGEAKVAVISGEPEYQNLEERLQGLQDTVKDYPGIELGEVCYDHYDGLTVMRFYQELSSEADAVVFVEGTGGKALETQFKERDHVYQYILGCDAFDGAGRGLLDGIVKQDTHQMGRQVVEEIARHIETGKYSTDCIYTDICWLTAENYDEVKR